MKCSSKIFTLLFLGALPGCFPKQISALAGAKNEFTIYYGGKTLIEVTPTGDKQCDQVRRIAVAAYGPKVDEFRAKIEDQRKKAAESSSRGLATTPEEEAGAQGARLAGVDIGESEALKTQVVPVLKSAINDLLVQAGCANR